MSRALLTCVSMKYQTHIIFMYIKIPRTGERPAFTPVQSVYLYGVYLSGRVLTCVIMTCYTVNLYFVLYLS